MMEKKRAAKAEQTVLTQRGLINTPGLRLSCQILCEKDMEIRAISRLTGSGRADTGPIPSDAIAPPAVWIQV